MANQNEEDGDDWSHIGVSGESEHRRDRTSQTRHHVVDYNSHQRGRRQNRSSRSLHFSDMNVDAAGFDFQNGRSQTAHYTREKKPPRPLNPFAPRPVNHLYPPIPPTSSLYVSEPTRPYPASSSPTSYYPPGPYPQVHYPPSHYPPNPFAAPSSQFIQTYDANASFQPPPSTNPMYHIPNDMENANRQLRELDMKEQQLAKKQQAIDEYEREAREKRKQDEAIERRREKKRKEEKIKREIQAQIKAELEKNYLPKRDAKEQETQSEPGRRRLDFEPRDLVDYLVPLVAERQVENNFRLRERRSGELDRLLLELADFYEHKLEWQDGRRSYVGSLRGPREVFQTRDPDTLRSRIEAVVFDVFDQLEQRQEADYIPERTMFASAEYGRGNRPRPFPQAPTRVSEHDWASEGQRLSQRYWRNDADGGRVNGHASPSGSSGIPFSSSRTARNRHDQHSPADSSRLAGRSPHPPAFRQDGYGGSTRPSAPVVDKFQEQSSQNVGDEGSHLFVNAQRGWSGEGRELPRATPVHQSARVTSNTNASRRRHLIPTYQDTAPRVNWSDESDPEDPKPPRSPRPFPPKSNHRGLDNTIPRVPPKVPDPPTTSRRKQASGSREPREYQRPEVREEMEENDWRPLSGLPGKP